MDDPWADAPPSKPATPLPSSTSRETDLSLSTAKLDLDPTPIDFDGGFADLDLDPGPSVPAPRSASPPPSLVRADDFVEEEVGQGQPAETNEPPADDGDEDDGFDDFDDFDAPAVAGPSGSNGEVDDFGDFGDFDAGTTGGGDAGFGNMAEVEQSQVSTSMDDDRIPPQSAPSSSFRALSLSPLPPLPAIQSSLSDLLSPLYSSSSSSFAPLTSSLSSEPLRQQPPARQILSSESSREAYVHLASPPQIKPVDWTRSRVRREHLISLGVPVNLDEVESHRLSAMPALSITTDFGRARLAQQRQQEQQQGREGSIDRKAPGRSASLDVRQDKTSGSKRNSAETGGSNRGATSVPASAHPGVGAAAVTAAGGLSGKYGLGERPEMDQARTEELCGLEEDQLTLLSPAALKKIQDELVEISAQASARLAWELQLKDAQAQDSATYNGMISELIANAAKAKSAQQVGSGGGVFRRGSNRRPASQSGGSTPAGGVGRMGSPVIR